MNSAEGDCDRVDMETGRRERGSKMKACLTIFTDVPFSPAGGCLLLLFLSQHQREEGQQEPVDRERTYTLRTERYYQHLTLVGA